MIASDRIRIEMKRHKKFSCIDQLHEAIGTLFDDYERRIAKLERQVHKMRYQGDE
jgi:hypothetical protein